MLRLLRVVLLLLAACGGASSPVPPPPARAPSASPEWWNGAVVYEVFVRSFRDSNGDGAGDLAGLIEKLDHLNDGNPATDTDLGVDAIWLMPIFPSPSHHGYDVTDYDAVNPGNMALPGYGTMSDFTRLITECRRRNIRVILDWVPNHTSIQHPWFTDSASSATSPKRDWYVWRTSSPGWSQPWGGGATWYPHGGAYYYAAFWDQMPDLDWRNPAVRAEIAAAAGRWLARGVDGFRLDAVRYLVENGPGSGQEDQPETHAALKELSASIRAAKPDALIVGEAWAETATIAGYFGSMTAAPGGDELPLTFDFPLADAVANGITTGSARPIAAALDAVARAYPPGAGDAPFLSNHDQVRLATRLAGNAALEKLAAAILLTQQGTPFIYYGEEIGLQNGPCGGDECKRTPMAWDATSNAGFTSATAPWWPLSPGAATANVASQTGDPSSLLSRYRRLIRVRKSSPALSRGGTTRLATDGDAVLAYLRTGATETVLVAHDLGPGAASATVTLGGTAADPLFVDPGATLAAGSTSGSWTVTLPPRGSGIWRVR
ncbi:MAG TPA: alpha-amylase family glycosyl hydrolase [Anaeromyxobacter sp.]